MRAGTDIYIEYGKALEEQHILGQRSMQTTESTGLQVTHKSSLTLLQARHCFLESQDPEKLALGQPVYGAEQMMVLQFELRHPPPWDDICSHCDGEGCEECICDICSFR